MNYADWIKTVLRELTEDSLWKMEAYRLALFAADLAWRDVTKLTQDRRTIGLASPIASSKTGIYFCTDPNLSEGYSRGSGRDRARFYEYSLGSAQESRTWYFDGRHVLDEIVTDHRLRPLTQIIRLLLTMVPQQRGQILHDDTTTYRVEGPVDFNGVAQSPESSNLLNNVPLP